MSTRYLIYNPLKVIPKELIKYLKRKFKTKGILLFGSYATKRATSSSDIDLLLITEKIPSKEDIMNAEKYIKKKYGRDVDLWVMHPNQIFKEIVNGNITLLKVINDARVIESSHHTSFFKKVSQRWMKRLKNGLKEQKTI